jgi:Zn-dependent metalloprotease
MCQRTHHHHPIFCILPPHILREIALNGTAPERVAAMETLATDQTFRTIRAAQPIPAATRRPSVLSVEGEKRRTIYTAQNQQNLPGTIVRAEGAPPSGDVAADEAYDGLGATFDSTTRVCRSRAPSTSDATTTTRSGTASAWSLAMATASCSTASRSRST